MPVTHPLPHPPLAPVEDEVLHVSDLHFALPDGYPALRGIDLTLHRGEKVALAGPNGAGKSTLMLHLNGILNGGKGSIRAAGLPVQEKTLPQIRAAVGLVFQNPDDQLFSPTVFEDVAFGPLHMGYPEDEARARVEQALARVGMSAYRDRLSAPFERGGKETNCDCHRSLDGLQLLVLDEPSAGLDPRARRALIRLLQELDVTMLVSTHDLALAREVFPRMVILDEGRIVADGPTAELLEDAALLEAHGLEKAGLGVNLIQHGCIRAAAALRMRTATRAAESARNLYRTSARLIAQRTGIVRHTDADGADARILTKLLERNRVERKLAQIGLAMDAKPGGIGRGSVTKRAGLHSGILKRKNRRQRT